MSYVNVILTVAGLGAQLRGAFLLSRHLFVSDEEINRLVNIPIEESTSNLSGATSNLPKAAAVLDVPKFREFRDVHVRDRRNQKRIGRHALKLIMMGAVLQAIGAVCGIH